MSAGSNPAVGTLTKTQFIMKDFLKIMAGDILSENFTKREYVVYGIIAPLALVAIMLFAGWIDSVL